MEAPKLRSRLELGRSNWVATVIRMTEKQILDMKEVAAHLSAEERKTYLRGVRDGMDLSQLIADDNKWPLAGNKTFQDFLDYLDEQPN